MTIFQTLAEYFSYPFVWYALIVGVLISLCSALFGVVLVLKRFSFIGDGLSHVAFGALAIATVINVTNNMLIVLPITVLCAILLLKTGKKTKIKGDAAIAMLSAGALAIGYLIMSLFSGSGNVAGDVCSTLFGSFSIITLSAWEVWLCIILSLIVIALFILFYNRIFAVTFDEEFAKASGVKASLYNLLIAVITGSRYLPRSRLYANSKDLQARGHHFHRYIGLLRSRRYPLGYNILYSRRTYYRAL